MCMGACTRQSEALSLYFHSYCSATRGDGSGTTVYLSRDGNNLWTRGKCTGVDSPVPGAKVLFAGRGHRVRSELLLMHAPKGRKRRKRINSVAEGGNLARSASNTTRPPLSQELDLSTQQV